MLRVLLAQQETSSAVVLACKHADTENKNNFTNQSIKF